MIPFHVSLLKSFSIKRRTFNYAENLRVGGAETMTEKKKLIMDSQTFRLKLSCKWALFFNIKKKKSWSCPTFLIFLKWCKLNNQQLLATWKMFNIYDNFQIE